MRARLAYLSFSLPGWVGWYRTIHLRNRLYYHAIRGYWLSSAQSMQCYPTLIRSFHGFANLLGALVWLGDWLSEYSRWRPITIRQCRQLLFCELEYTIEFTFRMLSILSDQYATYGCLDWQRSSVHFRSCRRSTSSIFVAKPESCSRISLSNSQLAFTQVGTYQIHRSAIGRVVKFKFLFDSLIWNNRYVAPRLDPSDEHAH